MKGFCLRAALVIILYALQTSLLPLIAWHGQTADLMLLLTSSFGIMRGMRQGSFMGFLAGLLQDLSTGTFFGIHTFSLTLIGTMCGFFSNRVFKEQFFLPILAAVASTLANYFILVLLMVLLGYRFNLVSHMEFMLVPMLVYQLVLAYPVHRFVYALEKHSGEKA